MNLALSFLLLLGVWHVQDAAGVGLRSRFEAQSIDEDDIASILEELTTVKSEISSMTDAGRAQALIYAKEKQEELAQVHTTDLKVAVRSPVYEMFCLSLFLLFF